MAAVLLFFIKILPVFSYFSKRKRHLGWVRQRNSGKQPYSMSIWDSFLDNKWCFFLSFLTLSSICFQINVCFCSGRILTLLVEPWSLLHEQLTKWCLGQNRSEKCRQISLSSSSFFSSTFSCNKFYSTYVVQCCIHVMQNRYRIEFYFGCIVLSGLGILSEVP